MYGTFRTDRSTRGKFTPADLHVGMISSSSDCYLCVWSCVCSVVLVLGSFTPTLINEADIALSVSTRWNDLLQRETRGLSY